LARGETRAWGWGGGDGGGEEAFEEISMYREKRVPMRVKLYGLNIQDLSDLAGSICSYNRIDGGLRMQLENGACVNVASGYCLIAVNKQRFNNLISADNQRFCHG
jgi:hypothetical protein